MTYPHLHKYRPIPNTPLVACVFNGCDKAKKGNPRKEKKPRRTIRQYGHSNVAECKKRIQALLREICLLRDKECVFTGVPGFTCNGYRKDGELILQADHMETRGNPRTYAESRVVVLVCKGHHSWKTSNKERYDRLVREKIGEERWNWIQEKAKSKEYPRVEREWLAAEKRLVDEIEELLKKR